MESRDSDHLFRRESGRMVAALIRVFGVQNLSLAEDVVQDAFCRALEVWRFRGVPDNPSAWLMTTAKNRAFDILRRRRTEEAFAPEISRLLDGDGATPAAVDELFGPNTIKEDLLRMMFSCCHPRLTEEAQVALMLNILCGFSVQEVASAFVTGRAAVEKRIQRAKAVLASSKRLVDVRAESEFMGRLPAVRHGLYLLFNEGYHGASAHVAVRAELCREAMRLAAALLDHPLGETPATYALSALMCLNAARMPTRVDDSGKLKSLRDQNRASWDRHLISEGLQFLEMSARGSEVTVYHLEAAIAAVHSNAASFEDTDWARIVVLYDELLAVRPSPIVALNRAIAIAQRDGPARGLEEIHAIVDSKRLLRYPFYSAAQGEFELRLGRRRAAGRHFTAAAALARNAMDREFFERRVSACEGGAEVESDFYESF